MEKYVRFHSYYRIFNHIKEKINMYKVYFRNITIYANENKYLTKKRVTKGSYHIYQQLENADI